MPNPEKERLNTFVFTKCLILVYCLYLVRGDNIQDDQCVCSTSNEVCYVSMDTPMTYDEASTHCRKLDQGSLVKLDPAPQVKEIIKQITTNYSRFWIGLDDTKNESVYRWTTDDTILDDQNRTKFRSYNDEDLDCVVMDERGNFKLQNCNETLHVTCATDVCKDDECSCYEQFGAESNTTTKLGNSCIITYKRVGTFLEQRTKCKNTGVIGKFLRHGKVVQLDPWDELKQIVMTQIAHFGENELTWIGLTDNKTEGEIIFTSNNETVSTESFPDFNAANSQSLDCVVINTVTGLLDYAHCGQMHPFVCQATKCSEIVIAINRNQPVNEDRFVHEDITFKVNSTSQPPEASFTSSVNSIDSHGHMNSTSQQSEASFTSSDNILDSHAANTPSVMPPAIGLIVSSVTIILLIAVVLTVACCIWQSKRSSSESPERRNRNTEDVEDQNNGNIGLVIGSHTPDDTDPRYATPDRSSKIPLVDINRSAAAAVAVGNGDNHLYEDSKSMDSGGIRTTETVSRINSFKGENLNYEDVDSITSNEEKKSKNGVTDKIRLENGDDHLYEDSTSMDSRGIRTTETVSRINSYKGENLNYEDVDSITSNEEKTSKNGVTDKLRLESIKLERTASIQSRKLPIKPDDPDPNENKRRDLPRPDSSIPSEDAGGSEQNKNYYEIKNRNYDEISLPDNTESSSNVDVNDVTGDSQSNATEMVYNDLYESGNPTNKDMVYNCAYEQSGRENNEDMDDMEPKGNLDIYDDIDS